MTTLVFAKASCTVIIFFLNAAATFAAFQCARARYRSIRVTQRGPIVLSYVNSFSVGLFLSVCFLGLFHSSCQKIIMIQKSLDETNVLRSYPISEAALCLGFFAVWMFECIFHPLSLRIASNRTLESKHGIAPSRSVSNTPYIPLGNYAVNNEVISPSEQDHALHPTESNGMTSETNLSPGTSLRSLFLVLAMSLHTILEALGFGLLDTTDEVIHMAVAMALHQVLCSSSLGIRLAQTRGFLSENVKCAIGILVGYLSLLPLGVFIACAMYTVQHPTIPSAPVCISANVSCSHQNSTTMLLATNGLTGLSAMALIQNFAAATFVYVIFMELLPSQMQPSQSSCSSHTSAVAVRNPLKAKRSVAHCAFGLAGFLLISGLRFVNYA